MGKHESKGRVSPLIPILAGVAVIAVAAAVVLALRGGGKKAQPPFDGTLHTPIGDLTFPGEWVAAVEVEDASTKTHYAARFYAGVGKTRVLLFELIVGEDGTGYQLGAAPDQSGKSRDVWLNISAVTPGADWPEEEVRRINTIQSCVNDLIEQIYGLDGFRERS